MALAITRRDIQHAHAQLRRYHARDEREKRSSENLITTAIRAAEVGGAAFTLGVVAARFPDKQVMNLPLSQVLGLGGAIGLHGLALWTGGKNADHLASLGDGALAFFATTLGAGVGTNLLLRAGGSPFAQPTKTSGMGAPLGLPGYRPQGAWPIRQAMTPAQIYQMAHSRAAMPLG